VMGLMLLLLAVKGVMAEMVGAAELEVSGG
jgi:hypothetical protein